MRVLARLLAFVALSAVTMGHQRAFAAGRFQTTVSTTVGWLEWCDPGSVTVDLDTGRYRWLQQLRRPVCTTATASPIVIGTLPAGNLAIVRNAVLVARRDGLARPECTQGKPSEVLVVSNGGSGYLLTLTTLGAGISAPGDLSCWSKAAFDLQRALDNQFTLPRAPRH